MGHHHIRVSIEGTNLFTTTKHEVRAIEVCGTNPLLLYSHGGFFFVQLLAPKKNCALSQKKVKNTAPQKASRNAKREGDDKLRKDDERNL
jgi:hypothetical protein